ncbi:MAG TPA: CopG family transcriptional regulator [Candidatus Paceibacterota bacterium]|nr:CopG family transcriptional regulator [Candidatus Paceibacterota bacterium]HRZ58587.1 CopG family transcriptional regulator [Candidatus Paceibacterota bacterium]
MTRTSIMLSEEVKRRAMAEARKLKVSFADFVRQAIAEKLPHQGKGVDRLKRRRQDPLFRLCDRLPLVSGVTATDVAGNHDDYLYGETPKPAQR